MFLSYTHRISSIVPKEPCSPFSTVWGKKTVAGGCSSFIIVVGNWLAALWISEQAQLVQMYFQAGYGRRGYS